MTEILESLMKIPSLSSGFFPQYYKFKKPTANKQTKQQQKEKEKPTKEIIFGFLWMPKKSTD